jgi:hypothetical protein
MQQRMRQTAYEEHTTATSRELERLRHENTILHSSACPPLEQDRELQVAYRRLSGAEHGWNYTRQLLDNTCEEVDVRTHRIIHLEHAVEAQESLRRGWRQSPTLSSSFCSYRERHHLHPWTMRRLMPCLASMRTRSCHCLGCGESLFEWI